MPDDDLEAFNELRTACVSQDVQRIQMLFAAGRADSGLATKALRDVSWEPTAVRCLLQHGADPSNVEPEDIDSVEVLRVLTDFGWNANAKGHSLLQDFASDRETLDWLLDHGVDINKSDTMRLACGFPLYPGGFDNSVKVLNNVAANGDVALFNHLVDRGADPHRSLALHYTSKCEDSTKAVAMLSNLLDRHAMDIHADTDDLRNFFHDAQDSGTPLCSAVFHKNLAVVEELLRRGSNPNLCGASGYPPASKAIGNIFFNGFLPALGPLLEGGADATSALKRAVRAGKIDVLETCLEHGADVDQGLEVAYQLEHDRLVEIANRPEEIDEDEMKADEAAKERGKAVVTFLAEWKIKK